jgi:hypothetical protein
MKWWLVVLAAAAGMLLGATIPRPSLQPSMNHSRESLRPNSQASSQCRAGAFVEASKLVNSLVMLAKDLPPQSPKSVYAELDTMLYTALEQARAEVHCVTGGLQFGYEKAYAGIMRYGAALAQARGLPKKVVQQAEETARLLEANKAFKP